MASVIQPLSVEVVHRMAAGEVIDSLAAAVRELIDNAIDAGATRIAIGLWPEDWRLRVADNGCGMTRADLQQAAIPHTTSKIQNSKDLNRITSLGFRGQALHSLAQLSTLEIYSRPAAEPGWHALYGSQGEVVTLETAAISPGTIVEIQDLFANWPERRQALPGVAQQLRAVQVTIYQSALCHPTVAWQVQQRDRPWFGISPGKTAREILPQLLATVRPADLQVLSRVIQPRCEDGFPSEFLSSLNQIEVVLGLPDRCHRHRPDWVQVAVNGRCVRVGGEETPADPLLQTILSAFRQTLPRHRHPVCFVHLRLSPEQIDWHRHPAKTDIYLHHLQFWQTQIAQTLQQVLQLPGLAPAAGPSERVQQLLKVSEERGIYRLHSSALDQEQTALVPDPPHSAVRALAQIHQTYILAEHPAGLWLVEQHIAHERVLYEQLCQRWQLVELNPPVILKALTPAQVEQLQQLGIAIDPFGSDLWVVRSAPHLLADRQDCPAALEELSSTPDLQAALVATACRSAIRNGTPLTLEAMQTLLDQWQQTQAPRTCPHGRPICLVLEESHLCRYFRRHWVIGKSHGI